MTSLKHYVVALLLTLLAGSTAQAADAELHGYLRAGAFNNGKGGKEECIYNRGSPANEFRLGNECAIYGEAAFLARIMKEEKDKPWFNTQLRLAYTPQGNSSFENQPTPNSQQTQVVEAFVEAGNVEGSPLTYWAGKRFYRDVDLYMFDWYYYAQMNGNGGGVGNIPLGSGKAAVAYVVETGSTRTNIGQNAVQVLDLRWSDVKLGEKDALNFWAALGTSPGGTDNTTPTVQYIPRQGVTGAIRYRHQVKGGWNDFMVGYGTGLMEGMNIYGTSTLQTTQAPQQKAQRARVVEHLSFQPFEKLATHFGAAVESWDPRKGTTDSRGLWWAVGARPVYFFTEHWQLAAEIGHSEIRIRDELASTGNQVGTRQLTRLTIAPQLALGPSLWARPVIRVFYTTSFWNKANQTFVAVDAPSFAMATASQAMGVQTEVWF